MSGADEARASGQDEDAPPRFTAAFYSRMYTLNASLDGLERGALPISVEEVCDVPRKLAKQAAQLGGADGVALVLRRTAVWQDDTLLSGARATRALDGADTASLRVRLKHPSSWRKDEDGNAIPTFRAGRIEITD